MPLQTLGALIAAILVVLILVLSLASHQAEWLFSDPWEEYPPRQKTLKLAGILIFAGILVMVLWSVAKLQTPLVPVLLVAILALLGLALYWAARAGWSLSNSWQDEAPRPKQWRLGAVLIFVGLLFMAGWLVLGLTDFLIASPRKSMTTPVAGYRIAAPPPMPTPEPTPSQTPTSMATPTVTLVYTSSPAPLPSVTRTPRQTASPTGTSVPATPTSTIAALATATSTPTGAPPTSSPTPVPTVLIEAEWPSRLQAGRSDTIRILLVRVPGQQTYTVTVETPAHTVTIDTPVVVGTPELMQSRGGNQYEGYVIARLGAAAFTAQALKEERQSLDQSKIEWKWNISSDHVGPQIVDVVIDVEWQPKNDGSAAPPRETVWGKGLAIEVWQPFMYTGQLTWAGAIKFLGEKFFAVVGAIFVAAGGLVWLGGKIKELITKAK